MRLKTCLLACSVSFIAISAVHAPPSYAQFDKNGNIVIAQSDNRSFLDKLFNRNKPSPQNAAPIYNGSQSRSGTVRPYQNYGTQTKKTNNPYFGVSEQMALERNERIRAESKIRMAKILERQRQDKARAMRNASGTASDRSGARAKKRVIYDADRVWSYDPNRPQQNNNSTIYNRR